MKALYFVAAGVAAFGMTPAAKAQDASWGCQILLCAASKNPSWQGVGYCVPPMQKLISAMKKPGFSWPICEEAKAGKPGHEPFEDCPAGFQAGRASFGRDNDSLFGGGEANVCTKTVNQCSNRGAFRTLYGNDRANKQAGITMRELESNNNDNGFGGGNSCQVVITQPRPMRADPYYFDIPNDKGVKERHWFNLNL